MLIFKFTSLHNSRNFLLFQFVTF
ncbi:hypothetical protein ACJIZ3_013138 [Penstemon smallii]|uniref:Uncharacterized protein n=1 Tax=Penstemon smallii TaxID=265156 RepID=A0ABD3UP09_9LAMI